MLVYANRRSIYLTYRQIEIQHYIILIPQYDTEYYDYIVVLKRDIFGI